MVRIWWQAIGCLQTQFIDHTAYEYEIASVDNPGQIRNKLLLVSPTAKEVEDTGFLSYFMLMQYDQVVTEVIELKLL